MSEYSTVLWTIFDEHKVELFYLHIVLPVS